MTSCICGDVGERPKRLGRERRTSGRQSISASAGVPGGHEQLFAPAAAAAAAPLPRLVGPESIVALARPFE